MKNIMGTSRNCDTVVGTGSQMKGELICKGPSKISGHIDGEIIGDDLLLIGPDAIVTGEVKGAIIEIDGEVKGTIHASNKIFLNETSKVEGDIHAPSVIVEEGAQFNGKSHMPLSNSQSSNILELEDVKKTADQAV